MKAEGKLDEDKINEANSAKAMNNDTKTADTPHPVPHPKSQNHLQHFQEDFLLSFFFFDHFSF